MMKKASFVFAIFLGFLVAEVKFDDFLGVGANPTPPADQKDNFSLVDGIDLSEKLKNRFGGTPLLSSSTPNFQTSDPISIQSSTGGLLTLWSLREGSWVWGYPPLESLSFGDARIWRIITYENGEVSFKNEANGNCLTAYGNGVIQLKCYPNDSLQRWKFIFFKNQAVQIKNIGYNNKCLQTPEFRHRVWYDIFLVNCVKSGEENLDQQWYIIPPAKRTTPVFVFN